MTLTIPTEYDGRMLRDYIKSLRISTRMLKRLKYDAADGILLNGERVTVRKILRAGDVLTLAVEDTAEDESEKLVPVDLPLEILYEDDDLVVPAKPADMPTHPSHDHYTDTVANALAFRYAHVGVPFVFRPVNRLDRNTSGLLLIARNQIASEIMNRAMREHRIRKQYYAILRGVPDRSEGEIETHLRRTAESIIVREVCGPDGGGDYALTRYRVVAVSSDGHSYSLAEASPMTGRTHQLRVHFAHIGCPIMGDDLYGPAPVGDELSRQALHAWRLSFPHPRDGREIVCEAPLPADMMKFIGEHFDGDVQGSLLEKAPPHPRENLEEKN